MSIAPAIANVQSSTVTFEGTTYAIQPLGDDTFTVLRSGVPVGRIVYTFGTANGAPDGDALSEEALTTIGEAWFAALDQ